MALLLNTVAKDRLVNMLANDFDQTSTVQLYYYNNTITQPIDDSTVNPFNPATFASALIAGPINGWSMQNVSSGLEFNTFPPATAATGSGTLSWCAIRSDSGGGEGTIIGPVSLVGGNGLLQVVNGGEGGGTGLTINVSDVISVSAFRMKW